MPDRSTPYTAKTNKTPKITRGWPPARRKAQAERIRQQKPWTKSTGSKTDDGKKRAALNAIKKGFYTNVWRAVRMALRAHKDLVKKVNVMLNKTKRENNPAPTTGKILTPQNHATTGTRTFYRKNTGMDLILRRFFGEIYTFFPQDILQLPGGVHFTDNVTSADEFTFDV